ncbi:MAG: lamin tail domain-containing protein [Candidatus Marinimicrobia bacterium]|nr:lamin tail domain-containing protein [Candidatus Neomarinimicrobiota bacterium]
MKNKHLSLILLILIVLSALTSAQNIQLNEIFFSDQENQSIGFIEIVNRSPEAVSILGYSLNINTTTDTLVSENFQYILGPGEFAMIVNHSVDTMTKMQTIPSNMKLFRLKNKTFGLPKNEETKICLFNEYQIKTDSVVFSQSIRQNHSLEFDDFQKQWSESKTEFGTPGTVNSVVSDSGDLCISTITNNGSHFTISLSNKSIKNLKDVLLSAGLDANLNGVIDPKEARKTVKLTLGPLDSASQDLSFDEKKPGLYSIIASVSSAQDPNPANNESQKYFSIPFPKSSILINEFMYAPESGKPEWIELFNNSDEIINLQYWQIGDQSSRKVLTEDTLYFKPGNYIVFAEDTSHFQLWQEEKNIFLAKDGIPSLNNSGDSIKILDPSQLVIDSLSYNNAWGNERGISLEKNDPVVESNRKENWKLSIHPLGGTPGFANSVLLKNYDLAIQPDSSGISNPKLFPGDTAHFRYMLENIGQEEAENFKVDFFLSQSDTFPDLPLETHSFGSLEKGQSIRDTLRIPLPASGFYYLKSEIVYGPDENSENNIYTHRFIVGWPGKSMVINEIMYDPDTGKPEWFEIANTSGQPINIKNWLFRDSQNTVHLASEIGIEIPADSFAVITSSENFTTHYQNFDGILVQSSSFPTLNNSIDSLILLDPVGNYIDSLEYSSEWGNAKNISLERKSTEQASNSFLNWSLSKDEHGSTPGFTNSVALKDFDLGIDTIYLKNENIIENQDATLILKIDNNGSNTITDFDLAVNVYRDLTKNIVISEKYINVRKTIAAGYYTRYEVPVNAILGGVHPVEAKIYALKDNIIENNEFSTTIKAGYQNNTLIVNEIMYSPNSGEAEWIELFNPGSKEIDLNSWLFKDISATCQTLTDTVLYIGPKSYAVVASNEEIFESYPDFSGTIIFPERFPTLNNTSDAVVIMDAVAHQIDSVYYIKTWGGSSGISIERRNPYVPAISGENWGSSQDSLGGTPGQRNTILKYDYDLCLQDFYFLQEKTRAFTENPFIVEIRNNGIYTSQPYSVEIYNDKNHNNFPDETELVWSLHNIPALTADSTTQIQGKIFSENSGRSHYIARTTSNNEENAGDNSRMTFLKIEFEEMALVINEFLPAPETGHPEFIECINTSDFDISLQDWELSNAWQRALMSVDILIPSGQYVVFANDSSIYSHYPPFNCPVIIMEDWPGMNNSGDIISLRDLTGKRIDSLGYHENWKIQSGKSLEKILPSDHSTDSSYWKVSQSEYGATPGKFNSISPYVYDLKISDWWISSNRGDTESLFEIKLYLENIGRDPSDNAEIHLYSVRFNSKSLYRTMKIRDMDFRTIDSLSLELSNLEKGYHLFLAQIHWDRDQNIDNDTVSFAIDISYGPKDVLISEFMAYPKSVKSQGTSIAEYIEIYNPQNLSVHIHNWTIADENSADRYRIISGKTLPAESYFVIASDSSIFNFPDATCNNTVVLEKFPSLNNDADKILLTDPTGIVTDSLVYSGEWKIAQGESKEKIYMENENFLSNWRSSTSPKGGTPGIVNSVVVTETAQKTGLKSSPNPFSPNGDGEDEEVGFFYTLSFPSANIRIDIYDLTGRLIASPVENLRTAADGVVYWDGTNKYGEMSRVGMYIARITANDTNSKKTEGHIATFSLMK